MAYRAIGGRGAARRIRPSERLSQQIDRSEIAPTPSTLHSLSGHFGLPPVIAVPGCRQLEGARVITRPFLQHGNFLLALYHSRRRYRVRPTRLGDRFAPPEAYLSLITVVSMYGEQRMVMKAQCGLFPNAWEDTDWYASAKLNAISMGARARQCGGA